MSVSQRIWQVGQSPQRLPESRLASEQELEEMIVAKPEIVSDQWMMVGRQEDTGFGGRIDLLAIAPDSSLILIELKRGRTPRAQALDYATWVEARITLSASSGRSTILMTHGPHWESALMSCPLRWIQSAKTCHSLGSRNKLTVLLTSRLASSRNSVARITDIPLNGMPRRKDWHSSAKRALLCRKRALERPRSATSLTGPSVVRR